MFINEPKEVKTSPNLERKRLQNTSLSETELSLLLGGILGDGSLKLQKGYTNARYSFRHSVTQKEYFFWKVKILGGISTKKSVIEQGPDGFFKNNKLRFCSGAKESLTTVLQVTHKGNTLNVKRSWLNHLTPLALAIWWFDDGSITKKGRAGCLATDALSEEAHDIIIAYFQKTWNVTFQRYYVTSKYIDKFGNAIEKKNCRLYLTSIEELKKFIMIIMPYIPCQEMIYKCAIRYNDQQYQERWISQMEELVPPNLKSYVRIFYSTT